ncbi:MAG: hypothetical protein ABR548_12975 [Actinomycetota bacterium]|nr:hypothetical protein [Actinomycetota bacterium]
MPNSRSTPGAGACVELARGEVREVSASRHSPKARGLIDAGKKLVVESYEDLGHPD